MGLPPWEISDGQLFALITGANSGLGFAIASRLIDEFLTSPGTSPKKHLILVVCTRSPIKTRFTISRLRAHLRKLSEYSPYATKQREKAKAQGVEYKWEEVVQRIHFLGVEVDLCNLKGVYAVADKLVNGTIGSPDATTIDGTKLPHGSPGTSSYSEDIPQDRWALSQEPGSIGVKRAWGWGLSGIRIPRLDVIFLTAGMGGWIGIDWLLATKDIFSDTIGAVTWPRYKISNIGAVIKSQLSSGSDKLSDESTQPLLSDQEKPNEPPLGEVFCSNVFGHYILAHELMPLLSRPASPSSQSGGKIIWISTIEALDEYFSIDDIQGLKSLAPYEASKRLIDLLALTADLPSVQRISAPFFDPSNTVSASKKSTSDSSVPEKSLVKPKQYLAHPGIFVSEILPLNFVLVAIYTFIFYCVRWLGSPWHPIEAYKAAVAPVWISLTDDNETEDGELNRCKWGSATNTSGEERVMKTEVPGWGWNGQVEDTLDREKRIGRKKGAVDLTKEAQEEFEILGGKCWAQMEELRKEWEIILGVKK